MTRLASRRQWSAAAILLGASLALPMAMAYAADNPAGELDGMWRLVSIELGGETRELDDEVRWVIKEGKVFFGGEPLAAVVSYAASTPKGIDLAFYEPKNDYEGIYALDNNEWKVCLNTRTTGPKDRPFDFETKEKTNLRVLLFKRLVPTDAGPEPLKGFVGIALALENEAVIVQSVLDKSPAEKAGLRDGDVILSVGNEVVKDLQVTVDVIRRKTPGSELNIRVIREGKEREIAVRVGVFPFSLLGLLG